MPARQKRKRKQGPLAVPVVQVASEQANSPRNTRKARDQRRF